MNHVSTLEHDASDDAELDMFRASIGRFLDQHAGPAQLEAWREAGVVDRALWRRAGATGLLCPMVSEAFGGVGSDFRFELAVIEELGRRGLEGFGVPVHSGIVAPYLEHFATEAQKQHWLPGRYRATSCSRSR